MIVQLLNGPEVPRASRHRVPRRAGMRAVVPFVFAGALAADAAAINCSETACTGVLTDLVTYPDGRVSIKLDGPMVVNGSSCTWYTLSGADTPGYRTVSSTLQMAYATGANTLVKVDRGTCSVSYVWLREP